MCVIATPPVNPEHYEIISDFLGAFGPEAEGHSDPITDDALRTRLEDLLRGKSTPDERRELAATLNEHRDGARILAEMIRANRSITPVPE